MLAFVIVICLPWQGTFGQWVLPTPPAEARYTTTVTMTTVGGTQSTTGCEENGCECRKTDRMVECRRSPFESLRDVNLPSNTELLELRNSAITEIGANDLKVFPNLRSFTIKEAPLDTIEPGAFNNLMHLEQVSITNTFRLLHIDYAVFGYLPGLKKLDLSYGELRTCPNLTSLRTESITPPDINLAHNKIQQVAPYQFSEMKMMHLRLDGNSITSIPDFAFNNSQIVTLSLSENPLSSLGEYAFHGIAYIRDLLLSDTYIAYLPTEGLKYIRTLDIQNTPRLTKFPPIFRFESIQVARLHYSSHCCAFFYSTSENYKMAKDLKIGDPVNATCPSASPMPPTVETGTDTTGLYFDDDQLPGYPADVFDHEGFGNFRNDYDDPMNGRFGTYGKAPPPFIPNASFIPVLDREPKPTPSIDKDSFLPQTIDPRLNHKFVGGSCNQFVPKNYSHVKCTPKPDSFNPCSDVMGYSFLRVCVWLIAVTALAGNGIVVVVLVSQKRKMTVPKFLMCNLAFADFCMGVYLLLVAAVDAHTLGEYLNYTFSWQYGAGCKVAGFISMYSSELSVFTLTVITIERWYTIIYAIDLNKRIRLRLATRIMVCGWLFSILVATLPFIGIGSYGTTSMCLPFYVKENNTNPGNVVYVTSILMVNALAFIVICACYIKMYVTVRNPHMVMKRKDSKVAKRMAILVFTDFSCWAPIAIFGIAGAFGRYFLTTDQSKILIVLFYPINSCANPFLYAIFTKSFRRDFFMLLAKHGMCEKRAMKYRPTVTSGPRSMSTNLRDNLKHMGYIHRDSSASVITGVSDSRASVVSMTSALNGSPRSDPHRKTPCHIPMSALATAGRPGNCFVESSSSPGRPGIKEHRDQLDNSEVDQNIENPITAQLAVHESLETVPEDVIGETKHGDEINDVTDSEMEDSREISKLVEKPVDRRELKKWRRADSGIHSIPSPSEEDCDCYNGLPSMAARSDGRYETVF